MAIGGNGLPVFDYSTDNPHNWQFIQSKTGGANEAGKYGGLFAVGSVKVYLKQDPQQDKNICEAFASQFMRFIAQEIGEKPDIIANVDYVRTDDGVYVASEVFEGYRDLYQDAYLAYQIPFYGPLRKNKNNKWQTIPAKRPKYLEQDVCINDIICSGRYQDLIPGIALRAIADDPDVNLENIGVVAKERSGPDDLIPYYKNDIFTGRYYKKTRDQAGKEDYRLQPRQSVEEKIEDIAFRCKEFYIKKNGKIHLIPNGWNARAVSIDFGGALGDFRPINPRKLDGKIHNTNRFMDLLRYRPSQSGPPAYQNQLPEGIKDGDEFFNTLARYSMVDEEKIKDKITIEINKAMELYKDRRDILLSFAKRIGVSIPDASKQDSQRLGHDITHYLYTNFIARQRHAKKLFLNYFCHLRREQAVNLINSYQNENLAGKELIMANFFNQWIKENKKLFDLLERIEKLDEAVDKSHRFYFSAIKSVLFERACKAKLAGKLEQTDEIDEIIFNTQTLITNYNHAMLNIHNPQLEPVAKEKIVEKFLAEVVNYQNTCISPSTNQKFIIAACTLAGALIGLVLGAALGLIGGAMLGGTLGFVVPGVGNIITALSVGSFTGLVTAIKGVGLGATIGTTVGVFLLGSACSYKARKGSRYLLFGNIDETVSLLANNVSAIIQNERIINN
ncbi:anion permease [Legionella fairfieldensis]|uniref:anion permease n=1 Tax=Legionella fairfieldensis TaxID=45064 RepID=UPI00048C439B|nr:anion permease [Legionella fairfieldensis]